MSKCRAQFGSGMILRATDPENAYCWRCGARLPDSQQGDGRGHGDGHGDGYGDGWGQRSRPR